MFANCKTRLATLDAVACQYSNKRLVKCIELVHEFNASNAAGIYIEPAVIWSAPSDIQYISVKLTRCKPQPLDLKGFSKKVHWHIVPNNLYITDFKFS